MQEGNENKSRKIREEETNEQKRCNRCKSTHTHTHTLCSLENKTSIFTYALLNIYARDG